MKYSLVEVEDAVSAIRQALYTRPRLILMDLHMPDMNACEAARRLLRGWSGARAECRLIGMTADDSQAALLDMYSAGFCHVLIKPFPVASLLARARFPGLLLSNSRQGDARLAGHQLQCAFLAQLPGQLAALDSALTLMDWPACGAILHRICGAAAMANLADFASMGRELTLSFRQPHKSSQLAQTYLDFLAGAGELLGRGFRDCE